jgi:hypothetical protein
MALNFLKHKWQKVTLICFTVFVVVLFALALIVNRYWSPILSSKVKAAVLSSTDSLYNINFSSAELHVLEGKILLYNIDLSVDTIVYNRLKQQGLAPNNLTELHVKRLVLSHIHPFKLYFKHILDIGRITLTAPDIQMSYHLNHVKDTVNKDQRTIWQKISKTLKYVHVGDIFLNDVKFKYSDYSGKKLAVSELKELNVQANELLIDSLTQTDTSRILYCKDIVGDVNNYKGHTADGLYSYAIKRAKFSTLTSQLKVVDFSLTPATNFFAKTHQTRFAAKVDSITLNNFDFMTYHKYKSFSASSLVIRRGTFDIFANPNGLKEHYDKVKSFPHVALFQLKDDLRLDTLRVARLDINYSEHNKKSDQAGTITFNRTTAEFVNITNNKAALQKNHLLTAHVTSYFMDRAKLNTDFVFNLTDKLATFSYKGHLASIDIRALNGATVPLAMVRINSGQLKSFDFDFKANRNTFKGKVLFLYNDLRVSLLRNDEADQQLKKKFIVSLFANLFVLKHNNPDNEGEIPRSFNVNYKRPIDFPFFKTIWRTLLLGIKPAVGVDEKTQKATEARMSQEQFKKTNRQIRKEKRIAKRALKKKQKEAEKRRKEAEKAKEN